MSKQERYDEAKHGDRNWQPYGEYDKKPKRGKYTVICNIRNHWWVKEDYLFNGDYWVTPGGSPARSVIKYDFGSMRCG